MPGADLAAIALMALATYATRAGGLWLIGFVEPTPRLKSALHHLSSSVLAALVVPIVIRGDVGTWVGVGIACAVMIVTRLSLAAMAAGTLAAALARLCLAAQGGA